MFGWAQNEKFAIISRIRETFSMRENSTLYKEKYTRVSPFLKNASECTKGINFTYLIDGQTVNYKITNQEHEKYNFPKKEGRQTKKYSGQSVMILFQRF